MELDTVESGGWDVLVEKRDGASFQAVGVLLLGFALGNIKEICISSLVEFQLFLVLGQFLVVEFEVFVLESLEDLHIGAEVDWCLLFAEFAGLVWNLGGLLLDFWLEDEIDAGSLSDWIFEGLAEVVSEMVRITTLANLILELYERALSLIVELAFFFPGIVIEVDVFHGESPGLLDLLF